MTTAMYLSLSVLIFTGVMTISYYLMKIVTLLIEIKHKL